MKSTSCLNSSNVKTIETKPPESLTEKENLMGYSLKKVGSKTNGR
jgi:hypothetical protein